MTAREKEKIIKDYMEKLDLSREEAEQLYLDDNSDELTPEQIELEAKAKAAGTVGAYTVTEKVKERTTVKERKVDSAKLEILQGLMTELELQGAEDITPENEVKIHFTLGGENYSITLTKHRKSKK